MELGPLAVSLLHSLNACQFINKCCVLPNTLTPNSGGSLYLPTATYLGDAGEEQVAMEGCLWDGVDRAEAAPPTLGVGEAGGAKLKVGFQGLGTRLMSEGLCEAPKTTCEELCTSWGEGPG